MDMTLYNTNTEELQVNDNILQMLDRGIDDMEAGRELPIDEAFQQISDLRGKRRNARA